MEINNSELQSILDKITQLRHELHRIPEASMKEYKTKQAIMAFIADNTALEIVDRGTWFYAVKKRTNRLGKRQSLSARTWMRCVERTEFPDTTAGMTGTAAYLRGLQWCSTGKDGQGCVPYLPAW